MNRCDFSSISTCLKNHISESNQMSQPDFLYELFEDFMDDPANQDFSMDNGLVCRWMTGQAKIRSCSPEGLYPPLCWITLWTVRFRNHAVIFSEEINNWKNYIPCLRKTVMFFFAESPESEKVNLPKPTQSGT